MSQCIKCGKYAEEVPLLYIGSEWIGDADDETEWDFYLCEACTVNILNTFKQEKDNDQPE